MTDSCLAAYDKGGADSHVVLLPRMATVLQVGPPLDAPLAGGAVELRGEAGPQGEEEAGRQASRGRAAGPSRIDAHEGGQEMD